MPSQKCNFITIYDNSPQVFSCGSEEIALASPPPTGSTIEDKHVYFVMHEPDNKCIVWHKLDDEIVHNAEIKNPKRGKYKKDEEPKDDS